MKMDFDLVTKTVNGEVVLVVEKRKTDRVSIARYNKEDIARKESIARQAAYIKESGSIEKEKMSFLYKG